jgi:hypothetical protein
MADAICLQDWITLAGDATSVEPSVEAYVDISGYEDVAIYADISNLVGASLAVQTSPGLGDTFFSTVLNTGGSPVVYTAPGLQPIQVVRLSDGHQVGRFVRWQVSGMAFWSVTFRIWLNLGQAPVRS